MASQKIYQFYSELVDFTPVIWRRFQIADNVTMARLGYVMMIMYEMQARHLFSFDVPFAKNMMLFVKERGFEFTYEDLFENKEDGQSLNVINLDIQLLDEDSLHYPAREGTKRFEASETIVENVISLPQSTMTFTYDFGDGWQIKMVLEEIIVDKLLPCKELPRVLGGEGYGIIEDCGGIMGLKDIGDAFKKKKGQQYREYCQWLGKTELKLEQFDLAEMNIRLKKLLPVYRAIYEYGEEPSQKEIDLIERL